VGTTLQAAANWHRHTEPDQWKNTHLTPILTEKGLKLLKGKKGWGLSLLHPGKLICNDQLESPKIH